MPRALAVLLAVAILAPGCGDDAPGGCRELRETEDPLSAQHLLTIEGYRYLTDPPTSGPHVAGPVPSGVVDEPIVAPVQVRILESGGALVQYDPEVVAGPDVDRLAATSAVVAPAAGLPAPVVVTAWTWKLTCDTVDVERVAEFVAVRPADAPGAD